MFPFFAQIPVSSSFEHQNGSEEIVARSAAKSKTAVSV
jgi:hypothetical protein